MTDIQVMPEVSSDDVMHVLAGTCWCQPVIDYEEPTTGGRVYVHRRFMDGPAYESPPEVMPTLAECPHGDPYCPCPDGDPCHYEPQADAPTESGKLPMSCPRTGIVGCTECRRAPRSL